MASPRHRLHRMLAALGLPLLAGCSTGHRSEGSEATYARRREEMVRTQIEARETALDRPFDARVLDAMRSVPRHLLVPEEVRPRAYADFALPIGHGQTISQPYVVAFMTDALGLEEGERVLEVGTGSGYQAAVLAELGVQVYSIEIVAPLAQRAARVLPGLGYEKLHLREGDGYRGWPEAAPFDAILLTAAPDHVPAPLVEQLRVGGRMILPVGRGEQSLRLLRREPDGLREEALLPVRFVPMTGEAQER